MTNYLLPWAPTIVIALLLYYIMAGRAFVVAKEVFIVETVVFWHCDKG